MYDVAVVGVGMIGSAALRHLSRPETGLRAVGVGPAEPADWAAHEGAFASHYDQARITRVTDPDMIWAALAQRAIGSYAEIERAGGQRFHFPDGHLRVSPLPIGPDHPLNQAETVAQALGVPLERLDRAALQGRLPYLDIPDGAEGLYERGGAGWINPRALVAAQLRAAAAQGAALVRDEVASIRRAAGGFALRTAGGVELRAARVLLSAHGWSGALLQASGLPALDLVNVPHTTVYAHLDAAEARRLAGMPSLIWQLEGHPVLPSVYTTPPSAYPDGSLRLKIGGPLRSYPPLDSADAIGAWFRGDGDAVETAALQEALRAIVPGLAVRGWSAKPCMNTYTAHGYPYVDQLDEGVFICTGGCGSAAKSSDEIGRVGALLAQHGAWAYDLPAEAFRAVPRR